MINIINIIGTPAVGGVQNGILGLSKYDKKFKINRSIVCLYPNYRERKGIFIDNNNIKVYYCTTFFKTPILKPYFLWKKIRYLLGYISFPFRFYFLVKKIKPNVIINEEPEMLLAQVLICKLTSIPFILYMHKELKFNENFNFTKFIYQNTFFISASKNTIKNNLGIVNPQIINKNKKIPIIPVSSPFESSNSKSNKKKQTDNIINIGTIGRLVPEKNFKQIIEISRRTNEKTSLKYNITIVGDGPLYDSLKKEIKMNNLENKIFLIGEISFKEIYNFLNGLDIYIQTSISEAGPIAIKEAMLCSLPVISSSVGNIPDIIDNGVNGFIVPVNNSKYFSDVLINLMEMNNHNKSKIGSRAKNTIVQNFSKKKIAQDYFNIINEVLTKA
jgi:glycosyltransferase involved in cell wall biosynthesis